MTSNDQVSLLLPMHHLMSWEEIVMEVEEGLATAFLSSCWWWPMYLLFTWTSILPVTHYIPWNALSEECPILPPHGLIGRQWILLPMLPLPATVSKLPRLHLIHHLSMWIQRSSNPCHLPRIWTLELAQHHVCVALDSFLVRLTERFQWLVPSVPFEACDIPHLRFHLKSLHPPLHANQSLVQELDNVSMFLILPWKTGG
jgi:hypothetical protein